MAGPPPDPLPPGGSCPDTAEAAAAACAACAAAAACAACAAAAMAEGLWPPPGLVRPAAAAANEAGPKKLGENLDIGLQCNKKRELRRRGREDV